MLAVHKNQGLKSVAQHGVETPIEGRWNRIKNTRKLVTRSIQE